MSEPLSVLPPPPVPHLSHVCPSQVPLSWWVETWEAHGSLSFKGKKMPMGRQRAQGGCDSSLPAKLQRAEERGPRQVTSCSHICLAHQHASQLTVLCLGLPVSSLCPVGTSWIRWKPLAQVGKLCALLSASLCRGLEEERVLPSRDSLGTPLTRPQGIG